MFSKYFLVPIKCQVLEYKDERAWSQTSSEARPWQPEQEVESQSQAWGITGAQNAGVPGQGQPLGEEISTFALKSCSFLQTHRGQQISG
jgi:hypothetical protein